MEIFKAKYQWQHALSIGIAILIATFANHYLAFSKNGWILLAAFLVMQTTRGTPIRQILVYVLSLLFALLVASGLNAINHIYIVQMILAIIYIFSAYFLLNEALIQNRKYFFLLPFLVALLINVILSENTLPSSLRAQLLDILIGSSIGLLCSVIIFPVKMDDEFKRGIVPILETIKQYTDSLSKESTSLAVHQTAFNQQIQSLERSLLADGNLYPEWIYEVGFNPGLRSGFRYFLLQVEHMAELLFSMSYQFEKRIKTELFAQQASMIAAAIQKNRELINVLIEYFKTGSITNTTADFINDITELETESRKVLPNSLELLDLTPDYLTLIAIIRDIKDTRSILLQLVMGLPHKK